MIEISKIVDTAEIGMRNILLIGGINENANIVAMTIVAEMSVDNDAKNEELDEINESDENAWKEENSEGGTGKKSWRSHSNHLLHMITRNLSKPKINPRPKGPPPDAKEKKNKELDSPPIASLELTSTILPLSSTSTCGLIFGVAFYFTKLPKVSERLSTRLRRLLTQAQRGNSNLAKLFWKQVRTITDLVARFLFVLGHHWYFRPRLHPRYYFKKPNFRNKEARTK
jgi:hypothetical protein